MDKKTLCTLREELVQEKIRCQQLTAELEQLNGELQRVGIDKERLAASDYSAGERWGTAPISRPPQPSPSIGSERGTPPLPPADSLGRNWDGWMDISCARSAPVLWSVLERGIFV